jgi:hypothetical protein
MTKENTMFNRMLRSLFVCAILLGMFATLPVQPARAAGANRYVSPSGSDTANNCMAELTPCLTIGHAITQSGLVTADQIHIAAGTFFEHLVIDRSVDLIGAGENLTIIDGSASGTTVIVNSAITVNLSDLNVQNGSTTSSGGGIYNSGTLSLLHVKVSGNTAQSGGGIYNNASLSLYDVFISTNTATTSVGGGIFNNSASSVSLFNVTVSGNTAATYSGGLHQQGGGTISLTNVTFSGNTAHTSGALTVTGGSSATLVNNTITDNHLDAITGSSTGGISAYSPISLVNTIIHGNEDVNCFASPGMLTSLGHNIDGDATCLTPAIAQPSDLPGTNPLLAALAKNGGYVPTHALQLGSPAIDSAAPGSCPAVDAASWTRPQDGNGDGSIVCDIGAFEAPSLAKFISTAANDGWVLESSEVSGVGGTMNSSATTFRLGDDAANKQYRVILHFDTSSLPNSAPIISATLKIKKQGIVGTNPFPVLGSLSTSMRRPAFGSPALEPGDFHTAAGRNNVAVFDTTPLGNWYSALLNNAGKLYIHRNGTTQFRIAFTIDDNNDNGNDYMKFFSGNASAAVRPQLIIQYYVP